jgi:hypothetical protein
LNRRSPPPRTEARCRDSHRFATQSPVEPPRLIHAEAHARPGRSRSAVHGCGLAPRGIHPALPRHSVGCQAHRSPLQTHSAHRSAHHSFRARDRELACVAARVSPRLPKQSSAFSIRSSGNDRSHSPSTEPCSQFTSLARTLSRGVFAKRPDRSRRSNLTQRATSLASQPIAHGPSNHTTEPAQSNRSSTDRCALLRARPKPNRCIARSVYALTEMRPNVWILRFTDRSQRRFESRN